MATESEAGAASPAAPTTTATDGTASAPPALDAEAIRRIVAETIKARTPAIVTPEAKPDPYAALREKWGLDPDDDIEALLETLSPTVEKTRLKGADKETRKIARELAEVKARLAESDKRNQTNEAARREASAQKIALDAIAATGLVLHSPEDLLAAAAARGLVRLDENDGELVAVDRAGEPTGQGLTEFFATFAKANPWHIKAAPAGGERVRPGAVVPNPPTIDKATLVGAGGAAARKAALAAMLQEPGVRESLFGSGVADA